MLKELRIQNIILIDEAKITFADGFNVITGETGAGKTGILKALKLIAGERGDSGLVRKDSEKAIVEAVFSITDTPSIEILLSESGIDHVSGDDLLIKRELSISGKNRIFVNHQLANLQLLKIIGAQLLHVTSQHANQKLFETDYPRQVLDLYGGIEEEAARFSRLWGEYKQMQVKLHVLRNSEGERLRKIETLQAEIKELSEADLLEEEEELLFADYSLLVNAEELASKSYGIDQLLNGDGSMLYLLEREKQTFDSLKELDPAVKEMSASYHNALAELKEVAYSISRYRSSIDFHPKKMEEVNNRLALINRLKRKYGGTVQQALQYLEKASEELSHLENADCQIEDLEILIEDRNHALDTLAKTLTQKREKAAIALGDALTEQLRSLNMENALFEIQLAPQKRGSGGDDGVNFFLTPNLGERRMPLRDCGSGGELSRLQLSLQTLLAGKETIPTLIFDEVDANIGGKTATIVGEKLRQIGSEQQLLCITHFPQVAKQSMHHLCISKKEAGGRTFTEVSTLQGDTKSEELARMVGQ